MADTQRVPSPPRSLFTPPPHIRVLMQNTPPPPPPPRHDGIKHLEKSSRGVCPKSQSITWGFTPNWGITPFLSAPSRGSDRASEEEEDGISLGAG